jgi:hypothetical protein
MSPALSFHNVSRVLLLGCVLMSAGCHKQSVFPRTHDLDEQTKVVLVDAWMLDHAPPLFQALIEYDGADPMQKYDARAFLRSLDGRYGTGNMWNRPVPVAPGPSGKPRVIWEFVDLPKEAKLLSLEISFTEKQTHLIESLKFNLPPRRQLQTK